MDRALVVGCRIATGRADSGRLGAQRKFQQALNHQSGFRWLRRQICYGFVSGGSIPFWMNLAPDLPGFGRTVGPARALDVRGLSVALADWLRATNRAGALLLANSTGCQVVVDLALHSSELLGPVVLVGPTVDRRARSVFQQWLRLVADQRWESPCWPG